MSVTSYSILTAIIYFNVFIAIFSFARRKNRIILHCGMMPLICLCILTVIRILCIVEFSFTQVVTLKSINWLYDSLQTPVHFLGYHSILFVLFLLIGVLWAVLKLLLFCCRVVSDQRRFQHAVWVTDEDKVSLCRQVTQRQVPMAFTADKVPYVVGFIRPVIFIPAKGISDHQLKLILMHEWQHFKSRDQWKKTAIKILTCLFWWNPFVYLLRFEVEQILELNCDRKVLKQLSADRMAYLKLISELATGKREPRQQDDPLVSEMVPWKKKLFLHTPFLLLKQRLTVGVNYEELSFRQKVLSAFVCLLILLLFAASYLVNLQPRYQLPETESSGIATFPEGTVLQEQEDGTYMIIVDGENWATLQDCDCEPFASMPIIPYEK